MILLGVVEVEVVGFVVEIVIVGDLIFVGLFVGVVLGLSVYYVVEELIKLLFDESVYED